MTYVLDVRPHPRSSVLRLSAPLLAVAVAVGLTACSPEQPQAVPAPAPGLGARPRPRSSALRLSAPLLAGAGAVGPPACSAEQPQAVPKPEPSFPFTAE